MESSDFEILLWHFNTLLWHFNTSHEFLDFVGLEMLFLIRLKSSSLRLLCVFNSLLLGSGLGTLGPSFGHFTVKNRHFCFYFVFTRSIDVTGTSTDDALCFHTQVADLFSNRFQRQ